MLPLLQQLAVQRLLLREGGGLEREGRESASDARVGERTSGAHGGADGESLVAGVEGLASSRLDLVVDADELVVLGNALRAAGGAGLDLSDTESDDEVGDGGAGGERASALVEGTERKRERTPRSLPSGARP